MKINYNDIRSVHEGYPLVDIRYVEIERDNTHHNSLRIDIRQVELEKDIPHYSNETMISKEE